MEFVHSERLVTTEWLAAHLDDPTIRILDVTAKLSSALVNRARTDCYEHGHIPGSVFFDVASGHGVLSDPDAVLPWMWPSAERFAASMAAAGVGPTTKVVLAARSPRPGIDSGTMWCTRAWWTMHFGGVDVAILHGGIERWEAEDRTLVTGETAITAAPEPIIVPTGWERGRATAADVLAAVDGTAAVSTCVVDALPADSFDGTGVSYGPRSGHITGAVNLPFRSLIDAETAGFVDPDEMHQQLTEAGLLDAERVITYCGGAIAATVDAFCLGLFGHDRVAVYDGSLMEWSANPDLPMSTGAD